MSKAPTAHQKQTEISDNELVDISTIHIDIDLPIAERVQQCINQVKNPYRFRAGGVIVNIEHLNNGLTLEGVFSSYLNDLM